MTSFPSQTTIIRGARVATPRGGLRDAAVVIHNGKITNIMSRADAFWHQGSFGPNVNMVDAPPGSILTPGLFDQHTHGGWLKEKGYGINFNLATVEDIKLLLQSYPAQGITRLIPTVMTGSLPEMERALRNLEEAMAYTKANPGMVQIEGIHLEGPFISTAKRGAHNEDQIKTATEQGLALLQRILAIAPDLKLITIAPEIPGAKEMIKLCKSRGIRVNIGHTAATAEDARKAIGWGARGVTHSFNAMEPVHHRIGKSGIIPVVMNSKKVSPEIIADGHHVDPETVGMFLGGKNNQNAILVSDGVGLVGSPEGSQGELGGQKVFNRGGAVVNEESNLAGSTAWLTDCVRNVVNWGFKTLPQAVNLASKNPAEFLGLGDRLGKIREGYAADFVLWSPQTRQVLGTWINGIKAYDAAQSPLNRVA